MLGVVDIQLGEGKRRNKAVMSKTKMKCFRGCGESLVQCGLACHSAIQPFSPSVSMPYI